MTIFHTSIITTLQPPKEKQIIPVFNGVGTQRATLKNISIKCGTGTYKLKKPNGTFVYEFASTNNPDLPHSFSKNKEFENVSIVDNYFNKNRLRF
jgi:hypothetical protein